MLPFLMVVPIVKQMLAFLLIVECRPGGMADSRPWYWLDECATH